MIIFSTNSPGNSRREIGLKFSNSFGDFPVYGMRVLMARLNSPGKYPQEREAFKRFANLWIIVGGRFSKSFLILLFSGPWFSSA